MNTYDVVQTQPRIAPVDIINLFVCQPVGNKLSLIIDQFTLLGLRYGTSL